MSKDELLAIIESAWDNGSPFIDYTDYYVYCLIPKGDGNWTEVSYDINDATIDKRDMNGTIAYRMLVEELEKGLSGELEDFMLGTFKQFREGLGDMPDPEKIVAIIKELHANPGKYSKNLPVVKSKDDLDGVKAKLK